MLLDLPDTNCLSLVIEMLGTGVVEGLDVASSS